MQLVQRVLMSSIHHHFFMSSLTYNEEMIPILPLPTGYDIKFAAVKDVQDMVKRIRESNAFGRPFQYFAVSELGSKKGRPHFHILWAVRKADADSYYTCLNLEKRIYDVVLSEWKRNLSRSDKFPVYKDLCTYRCILTRNGWRTNYDTHYVNPTLSEHGVADAGFYVLKYMLKPSDRAVKLQQALRLNLSPEEYEGVWSIVKPRYFKSQYFGDDLHVDGAFVSDEVDNYIGKCLIASRGHKYPEFINPVTGQHFPLARYYRSKFLHDDVAGYYDIYANPGQMYEDDHVSQLLAKESQFEKRRKLLDGRDFTVDLDI